MEPTERVVYGPVDEEFLKKNLKPYRIRDSNSAPNYEFVITHLEVYVRENGQERVLDCPRDVLPLRSREVDDLLTKWLKEGVIAGYTVRKV